MSTCDLNSRRSIVVVASTTLSGRSAGVDAQPIAYDAQQCCPFSLCLMCHRQLPQSSRVYVGGVYAHCDTWTSGQGCCAGAPIVQWMTLVLSGVNRLFCACNAG